VAVAEVLVRQVEIVDQVVAEDQLLPFKLVLVVLVLHHHILAHQQHMLVVVAVQLQLF
jgi:hypothetical protein